LFQKLLFTICFAILATAVYAQGKVYAVAFYNLENLFDTLDDPYAHDEDFTPKGSYRYTDKVYKQKLHNIAGVFQSIGTGKVADGAILIGVAEIENNRVLNDLLSQPEIKSRGYKYVWYNSRDERGIDVALVYNPKFFKPLMSKPLPVSLHGSDATRDVLYVMGTLVGDTVHVLVNHWPSRREGREETADKRNVLAMVNRKKIDAMLQENPKARILVMGDLNDNPTDGSVQLTLGAKADRNSNLYNPWIDLFKNGKGTGVFERVWYLFDQVIISNGFMQHAGLQYDACEIYDRPFLRQTGGKFIGYPRRSFRGKFWNNGYSDHFPVVVYLKK
jgi:hypothetical protein